MFDLNQASEGSTSINYQTPGIFDNVKISEFVLEETSANKVPYIRYKTIGANNELGSSPKMFLSTDVKEGKKTSGWGVTARNIVELIKATHNVDDDAAKALMPAVSSKEELAQRLSALLVNKSFRAKFKGRTTEKGNIIAEVAQVESMRVSPTKMFFNPNRDIEPFTGTTTVTSQSGLTAASDGLPF